jgi:carboxymethylenebutenolidase
LNAAPRVKYHPVPGKEGVVAELKGAVIEFPANGRKVRGYLSKPESGSGPGVLVIQEWWGLVENIKNIADRIAASGYVALAPDLYHGEATKSPDEAGKLMMALNIEETEKDLRGASTYLLSQSSGKKLGVVGFCMGGQLALFAASKNEAIGACVDFYGIHPNVKPNYPNTNIQGAPVLGLFAEKDAYVSPEVVKKLEAVLKQAGIETDFTIYPGCDHGFFNDTRKEVHDVAAAADAWNRLQVFFRKYLK